MRLRLKIFLLFGISIAYLLQSCGGDFSSEEAVGEAIPDQVDYNLHVRPILSDRCYSCHGPDQNARKANLRLDTKEGLFRAGISESQEAPVVPGRKGRSPLYHRIVSQDPAIVMPPPESNLSLTTSEIAILERWIEQGAEWKPHWSFIPPVKPTLPTVEEKSWPENGIDYFVLAKLENIGLKPNGEAEKETLLRRVSLDLTGLPPSPQEIDEFLADDSPDAYEKVVDRLLASPHYGEHMAVRWLDLARYADTHGYQADYYRPHWPWRDWVIESFNKNMPYDEFVTWQLAGDLLPDPTVDQILATGFNRNHAQNAEGGIVEEEFRVEYVADRTQTFGTAFLGLTLQCARCHDHKYDPISQKEFYQLFSFFNNVAESGQITWYKKDMPGPTLLLPDEEVEKQLSFIDKMSKEKQAGIEQVVAQQKEQFQDWLQRSNSEEIVQNLRKPTAYFPLERAKNENVPNLLNPSQSGKIIDPVHGLISPDPIQFIQGKNGKGIQLTGDYALSFPNIGRFSRAEEFSVGMWVYIPKDLEKGVIFHSNKGSALYTYKGYQVSVEEGRFDVRIAHDFPYNTIHLLSKEKVPREKWCQLTLVYDGSSKAAGTHLYLDGEELAMEVERDNLYKDIIFHPEQEGAQPPIMTHLKVGARWRGKGFTNGGVDEIMVFDAALTELEVKQIAGKMALDGLLDKKNDALSKEERQLLFDFYLANYNSTYQKERLALADIRKRQIRLTESITEVMVMEEMTEPRVTFVLDRGVYDQPTEEVHPGTPVHVLPFQEELSRDRLGLAKWLFQPDNPLPARVTVNRYWQHYFGRGLVKSTEDFGSQGDLPSHPSLLDWLARTFVESGWDSKKMQKLIVMSATYRQSSNADPIALAKDADNKWLSRGPKARLSAEVLRDLALSASGLLVREIGGPPVKIYQPEGLWDFNRMSGEYQQDHGKDLYRRSIYTFWKRTIPPPSMNIFDAPTRAYCVVKRERTATPLQALVLMNDPQFIEASRVLAERMVREGGNTIEENITYGFRLLTSQYPKQGQLDLLKQQYNEAIDDYRQNPEKASQLLQVGEYPVDDTLDEAQIAAMTNISTTILNFEAAVYKK